MRNRRGSVLVLIAVALVTLCGLAGLGIDVGMAYRHRAAMQMAADAAALAACVEQTPQAAQTVAERYAAANGFTHNVAGCTVTAAFDATRRGELDVTIVQPYLTTLVRAVGATRINVSVIARSRFTSLAPVTIVGNGRPGVAVGAPTTLALFGPYAVRGNGDAYSSKFLSNGQPNPTYNPRGVDFLIRLPANYRTTYGNTLRVDIFDPDCGNPNGVADGIGLADEIRAPQSGVTLPAGFSRTTGTQYTLHTVPGDPNDYSSQTQIATRTYAADNSVSQVWTTPAGFSINLADHPGVNVFRLNATTVSGSSENGFFLRAGPPSQATVGGVATGDWVNAPADLNMITSTGVLPLNANDTQQVVFNLGNLPAANGVPYTVRISKFDTDSGSTAIAYEDDVAGTNFPAGTLTASDQFRDDVLNIPSNYPGSQFRIRYNAGAQDTSSWTMSFDGAAPGVPGRVRLIR